LTQARKRLAVSGVAVCAAILVGAGGGVALADVFRPQPQTITQTANTAADAYGFLNTNAGGSGLVGQVGPSLYGDAHAGLIGVYDAAGSTVGYGVFGLSSTGFGVYGKGTSSQYGGVYGTAINNGVVGVSSGASGVFGQTSAANHVAYAQRFPFSSSTYGGRGGVTGNDVSPSVSSSLYENENAGVVGASKYGLAGVVGTLTTGGPNSYGGVLGATFANELSGVYGFDGAPGPYSYAVTGYSLEGTGVEAISLETGVGLSASSRGIAVDAENVADSAPALLVAGANTTKNIPLILAQNNDNSEMTPRADVFSVGSDGSVVSASTITASSSPLIVTRGAGTARYGSRTSTPTIEDVGFANLTNGRAAIRFDATFASTIDPRAPYAVFLSPEGENDGLYVTAKTGTGFLVREAHGGRSTLPFSYRILARPLDMPQARRLPDARTAATFPAFDVRSIPALDVHHAAARLRPGP
jgi:hypothetical protein